MTRRRWLRAHWPFDTRTLSERFRSLQFTNESQSGFIVDRLRSNSMEGRFIERQEVTQVVENPFGRAVTYERTEFRSIPFIVSDFGLEIISAPRSISLFMSKLAEACHFKVSISEVRVDVVRWCEELATDLGRRVEIVSCQLRDIKIADNITATAVLKSNTDVRQAAYLITRGASYTNDKIKVQIEGTPYYTLILTRQGSATIDKNASDSLLESLRRSLYSSLG